MFPYLEHNHQEDGLQNHRAPLYPSLSILITSLQSPNYNATLHREANPALCESDWKTGPALKSQHIIYPQNCFFKLVDQRASLQQHWQGQRQMSETQIPAVISALMIPFMESWSETCFHHSGNPLAMMYAHSHTIPPRDSLSPSKSQPQKSFIGT